MSGDEHEVEELEEQSKGDDDDGSDDFHVESRDDDFGLHDDLQEFSKEVQAGLDSVPDDDPFFDAETTTEEKKSRRRLSGLQNLGKPQLLRRLYSLTKLKGILAYCKPQSRVPNSKTRKNQYHSFAEVILSLCFDDFDAANGFCDSISSCIDEFRFEKQQADKKEWEQRLKGGARTARTARS